MQDAVDEAAQELSAHAPRLYTMKINPEKIRDVIGKGGATIRALTEETGTEINIEEDGTITIAASQRRSRMPPRAASSKSPPKWKWAKLYEGTVSKILATTSAQSCQVLPGKDGLVHISQIAHERVNNVGDYLKEGQTVNVKALEADDRGRVRLSIKALLEAPAREPRKEQAE